MEKTIAKLKAGIVDEGCCNSQDFKNFTRTFKREFKKEIEKVGGTNLEQSMGHYYLSGFFDVNEQSYYYSISDVRYQDVKSILLRTAKNHKDFTGGRNHFVTISEDMLVGNLPRE